MIPQPQFTRERRISGSLSNHSQASTPISEHPKGMIFQPMNQIPMSMYSTLPKDEVICKPLSRDIARIKGSCHAEMMPRQPIEAYFTKTEISGQYPAYFYEPIPNQSFSTLYSHTNPPNYYPSLQIRGTKAQKPLSMHPPKPQQKRRSYSPPQNYYPSLPTYSKQSQHSNRYSHPPPSYSSLDRQATPTKKRQSVPLTRHTSMPASERPIGYVSPLKAVNISSA